VVKEAEACGRRVLGIRANVGNFAECQAMVERTQSEFGHLDILVCNARVFHHTAFIKMSEEEWDEVLTIDLKGIFNCVRAAIGQMTDRRWGRIIGVTVTATSGVVGPPQMAHISAAKTSAHGLIKSIAAEVHIVWGDGKRDRPRISGHPCLGELQRASSTGIRSQSANRTYRPRGRNC
jgi:3-oxoacyl-[acyl-carrier protein] reductase